MFKNTSAFSSFSVDNLKKAQEFYGNILGLEVSEIPQGLNIKLKDAGTVFVYPKPDHVPATFTILNFVVDDIDKTVDDLNGKGIQLERYDMGEMKPDAKGIYRSASKEDGPTIAWFKDPAGNVVAILEGERL
jgi:catechol 2,3-dioxygenase-like lactoylglutathione lyase family enzyme